MKSYQIACLCILSKVMALSIHTCDNLCFLSTRAPGLPSKEEERQWWFCNLCATVMWQVIVCLFFLLNFQCLKQYMQLAIRDGCGSPITCPDMVCLNHGILQEAEVWMSVMIFPSFLLTLCTSLTESLETNDRVNFLKKYFIATHLWILCINR